jgi:GH43 family beta-xylosidase
MYYCDKLIILSICIIGLVTNAYSQNPLIMDQFTADPTARVFEGKLYLYPSHDVPCGGEEGVFGFCMPDYHVFSSKNLTDWEDHGIILSHNTVPWVEPESFRMWAPDCVFKNGKYYFYFPAWANEKVNGIGYRIGVAIANKPYGPFVPEANFIEGVTGIDPNVFIDDDGKAYLYWSENKIIYGAQLKDNMVELATVPVPIKINGIVENKFKEGPFVFKRKGIIYLTFPYNQKATQQLVYAIGSEPLGTFEYKNVLMKESPIGCQNNHQSVVEYKNQWYLFYHHNDLSPKFDKNRSAKADSLFFNEDGSIQEIIPSKRGIGVSNAKKEIQIDRYSAISDRGTVVDFIDEFNAFKGWKTVFSQPEAWIGYNAVEFPGERLKKVLVNVQSDLEGSFEIRLNAIDGKLLAKVNVEKSYNWATFETKTKTIESGIYDLFIVSKSENLFEINWIKFK